MDIRTRKLIDRYFSGFGIVSILLMGAALLILLGPIAWRGVQAYIFRATVEWREMQFEEFDNGAEAKIKAELAEAKKARQPVYDMLTSFENDMGIVERMKYKKQYDQLKSELRELIGPLPGDDLSANVLPRDRYGAVRWAKAEERLERVLYITEYVDVEGSDWQEAQLRPRAAEFEGTPIAGLFEYVENHLVEMMRPKLTFYPGFFTQTSKDSHIFGGIWAEVLGTFYLTLGAIIFAVPMGVVAAIYLVEYARENLFLTLLRTCVSTLAGVPSIVFGLFGLAFFINTVHVSEHRSVLAGSLTLAILVLPTVIRASEEAIRAVPGTYREAALSMGATRWRTILTVILPAALPGILTSIVISMGRAAGETAPIIFTAAVSVGQPLNPGEVFSEPTPALPWNIYNISTEHEAADQVRHVQFGMVLTLVGLVLILNMTAIILRARISKKLKG